jgi:hypothetical protein
MLEDMEGYSVGLNLRRHSAWSFSSRRICCYSWKKWRWEKERKERIVEINVFSSKFVKCKRRFRNAL